jgi:hypothetical protein
MIDNPSFPDNHIFAHKAFKSMRLWFVFYVVTLVLVVILCHLNLTTPLIISIVGNIGSLGTFFYFYRQMIYFGNKTVREILDRNR